MRRARKMRTSARIEQVTTFLLYPNDYGRIKSAKFSTRANPVSIRSSALLLAILVCTAASLCGQTGTLSGIVSDVSNAGIVGVTVQALQNGVSIASATSGSNGSYSISNLPSRNYDSRATANGYGTSLKNSVHITANQTTTQNFTLSNPGSIAGQITQANGVTAVSGASVQADVGSAVVSSTTSDGSGNYSISGLNAGSYRVQVTAAGYVTKSQNISVTGGSTTATNFSLQANGNSTIQYVHDELGRLISATDSGGDTAVYQYDSVGNILS